MTSKILENFLKELSVKALKYGYLDCEKEAKDFLNKHKETINFTGCCEELSKRPNTSSTYEVFTKSEKKQKGNI